MFYWIYWYFIRILDCICLNQDLQDKKSRPGNQEINGMNACRRSPKSTPNARMAFVGYECLFGIPRVTPTEYKMSDFAVLTPTYEDWFRE